MLFDWSLLPLLPRYPLTRLNRILLQINWFENVLFNWHGIISHGEFGAVGRGSGRLGKYTFLYMWYWDPLSISNFHWIGSWELRFGLGNQLLPPSILKGTFLLFSNYIFQDRVMPLLLDAVVSIIMTLNLIATGEGTLIWILFLTDFLIHFLIISSCYFCRWANFGNGLLS